MNIIQLQDRLKGLPTEALVNYVESPMGEVPIYLALSELQRRKEMRERFMADQMPPPSVAEQIVDEAKPKPVGIAEMAPQRMMPGAQGVGAPQPAPQIDPRQMAASGIAANSVSNVGGPAMMAKGGIVGEVTNKMGKSNPVFEDGSIGAAVGFAIPPVTSAVLGLGSLLGRGIVGAGRGIGNLVSPLFRPAGTKIAPSATTGTTLPAVITPGALAPTVPTAAGYLRQPGALIDLGALGALSYGVSQLGGDPEPEDNKEETEKPKGEPGGGPTQKEMTLEDYVEQFNKAMGENEGLTRAKTRLEKLEKKAEDRRKNDINRAIVGFGLGAAAGQSPDALTNIAAGGTAALKDFEQSVKEADKAEKEIFALNLAIDDAARAERRAAVNFGMKSIEAKRASERKLGLIQYKAQLEAQIKASVITPDVRRKIREDLIAEGVRDNIIAQLTDTLGENAVGTKEFNDAVNQQFELAVQEVALGPAITAIPSSQFKVLGIERS
tara:strand:+ start:30653 stop:32137 length:1485 start_codon:yes stop_codon:yes gene_type:complete